MSVHGQPDFARVYDEDEMMSVRRGDLRALLDCASTSMDFGSGMLNDEEVEILRKTAEVLDVDPLVVTPSNHVCKYKGRHEYVEQRSSIFGGWKRFWCPLCYHSTNDVPDEYVAVRERWPDGPTAT